MAGWDRGEYAALRGVTQVRLDPAFSEDNENPHLAVALLTLDAPVHDVTPMPVRQIARPELGSFVGYTLARKNLQQRLDRCNIWDTESGLWMNDCTHRDGMAGVPMFVDEHVVAINVGTDGTRGYAAPVPRWVIEALGE